MILVDKSTNIVVKLQKSIMLCRMILVYSILFSKYIELFFCKSFYFHVFETARGTVMKLKKKRFLKIRFEVMIWRVEYALNAF